MMRQQYQTLPARGSGAWFLKLMSEGWQRCKKCDLMYKCDGPRCPECRNKFSTRLRYRRTAEVRKMIQALKRKQRICSVCNATKTYKYNGIAQWFDDGHEGWMCFKCRRSEYRKEHKAEIAEYNRRYHELHKDEKRVRRQKYEQENRAYITERQRLYRKGNPEYHARAREYWERVKAVQNAKRRERDRRPEVKEKRRLYYAKNRERISAQRKKRAFARRNPPMP